jgi:hypothetical protein
VRKRYARYAGDAYPIALFKLRVVQYIVSVRSIVTCRPAPMVRSGRPGRAVTGRSVRSTRRACAGRARSRSAHRCGGTLRPCLQRPTTSSRLDLTRPMRRPRRGAHRLDRRPSGTTGTAYRSGRHRDTEALLRAFDTTLGRLR